MKKAFVTGVSGGIGKAIVEKLAGEGCEIVGIYNSHEPELTNSKEIEYAQVDFSSRKETLALIDKYKDVEFDYIVNCAGVFEDESVEQFDLDKWDRSIEIMLTTPYIIVEGLSKNMKPGSAIVNIASNDAATGAFVGFGYSAAKSGLISLTKSLGNVLGYRSIRVNAIAPGWIDTNMGPENDTIKAAAEEITPLGRIGKPEEIAETVAFLLSEKASFINGAVIFADGGQSNVDYTLYKEWKS